MTHLRKMMLEELERRNYAQTTRDCYIQTIEDFARYFKRPPDQLGPEHIRHYQAYLFRELKLAAHTVTQRLAGLRFFFIQTMEKPWSVADTPYPKKARHLPSILGPEEVALLIDSAQTHRVAISNHRLISLADGQVTFRWHDSAHHNEQKVMSLSLDEFLRRFLLHLLPKGFVRIRHFGFLANRRRTTLLPFCWQALDAVPPQAETPTPTTKESPPLWLCPNCGGPMVVIERLTAAQLQLRSPPFLSGAAA